MSDGPFDGRVGRALRKWVLTDEAGSGRVAASEIDLVREASLGYSSEDPAHTIDNLADGTSGPGAPFWRAAKPDTSERIVVALDRRQPVARLVYEAEDRGSDRTQEVRVEASSDGGESWRTLLVQEFNFSPDGATFEREDLRLAIEEASHLRLTITPNKRGSGTATLTTLRLFRA